MIIKPSLFILCSVFALWLPFVILEGHDAMMLMRRYGYYVIAGTVAGFLYLLVRNTRFPSFLRECRTHHRWGVVVILLCTAFLTFHEPHRLKVEYDESVLSITGLLMHKERIIGIPDATHYINGRISHSHLFVDKRPILFPFLISVLHDLTGQRLENVFVLNAMACFLLLAAIYGWVAQQQGPRLGILAVLLLTTLPLLAQNATSGGMDLLNAAMIVVVMHLGLRYLKRLDGSSMNLFVLGLLLLAQARYESLLFTIPGALIIGYTWWQQRRINLTWFATFSPLLLLSPLLSIRIFISSESYFQLGARDGSFFDLSHIPGNAAHAVYYFFRFNRDYTNSFLLSILGAGALVFTIALLVRQWRSFSSMTPATMVFTGFLGVVLFNVVWALSNFWGQFDDPVVSRITLPIHAFMALCIALVGREFLKSRVLPGWVYGIPLAFIVGFTLPSTSSAFITEGFDTSRTTTWTREFIKKETTQRDLFIGFSSLPWVLADRPAITANRAISRPEFVIRSTEVGFYDNVYFISRMRMNHEGEMEPMEAEEMHELFEMELLSWQRYRPFLEARIYRILSLKEGIDAVERLEELRARKLPEDADISIEGSGFLIRQLP